MTHASELNLPAIRNRAYAVTDGLVQIGYEIDCACEPSRWLAFVSADHPNADSNAEFLQHAHRDVLALLAEMERLTSES
jgi:hypothetical protein